MKSDNQAPNPYLVSLYRGATDPTPTATSVNGFDELCSVLFSSHRVFGLPNAKGKTPLNSPAFSPAEFDGNGREKTNVVRVHFGVLDLDGIDQFDFVAILEKIKALRAITYSTYSHGHKANRNDFTKPGVCARVVFPFTRTVHVKEWPFFWRGLNAWIGTSPKDGKDLLDPNTKNEDRLYYLPGIRSEEDRPYGFIWSQEGNQGEETLDVDRFIAIGRTVKPGRSERAEQANTDAEKRTITKEDLIDLATTLKRKRSAALTVIAKAIEAICEGRIYGGPGERDGILFQICGHIARYFRSADPEQFASLFVESFERTNAAAGFGSVDEDVRKLVEKFTRQKRKVEEDDEAQAIALDAARRWEMREAWLSVDEDRDTPYTIEELAAWRNDVGLVRQHVGGEEVFGKRWILVRGKSHYVFVGGKYLRPIGPDDFMLSIERDLSPAHPYGVSLNKINAKGDLIQKQYGELVRDYGTSARNIIVDLAAQVTRYNPVEQAIYEAPCPLRPIEPRYDLRIDQWLRLLAGNTDAQYQALRAFVAFLSDLSKPCVVLYLDGDPGVGKSLFAKASARLWTTRSPTTLAQSVALFNDRMVNCPLIFADEKMPRDFLDQGTAMIREFQQNTDRDIQRKHLAASPMIGAIRLIMASNNKHMIDTKETITEVDIEAIRERILYVKADPAARQYLQTAFEDPEHIITHDLLAAHSLWLRQNSGIKAVGRFMIPLDSSVLSVSMTTTQGIRAQLVHWLISYLQRPQIYDAKGEHKVHVRNGELWINAQALSDGWDLYPTNTKYAPPVTAISNGLRGIVKKDRAQARINGQKIDFRIASTEVLYAWSEETGIASKEEIDHALTKETKIDGRRALSAVPTNANPFDAMPGQRR